MIQDKESFAYSHVPLLPRAIYLFGSALLATLLLIAHICMPDKVLSLATNLVCMLICIVSSAVCCVPTGLWRTSHVFKMLFADKLVWWFLLSNLVILMLLGASIQRCSVAPSPDASDSPLSVLVSQFLGWSYLTMCRCSSILLLAAWTVSAFLLWVAASWTPQETQRGDLFMDDGAFTVYEDSGVNQSNGRIDLECLQDTPLLQS
eukprot:Blabericola_migrator_1__3035@NODE_1883_length_3608_cov_126_335781_g1206_i0_p3_GENE_NODE_1883_length_3608_cov_126_335781_g1206_i0NODE_1883_length_3608_cov_126_335781_g1206_i0_p3_ORF_typecomplete_len205_score12_09_NODE_1883_length_3608_cov_126_335781_g1206_i0120734